MGFKGPNMPPVTKLGIKLQAFFILAACDLFNPKSDQGTWWFGEWIFFHVPPLLIQIRGNHLGLRLPIEHPVTQAANSRVQKPGVRLAEAVASILP